MTTTTIRSFPPVRKPAGVRAQVNVQIVKVKLPWWQHGNVTKGK